MKPEFLANLIDRFFDAAIAPFAERLALLEARPLAQDGKSVTLEEVRPLIESAVEERIKAIPTPKDGTSVTLDDVRPIVDAFLRSLPIPKDGKDGEDGDDGDPGKSVTLEEVRSYLDAELATWALSFERRAQDTLQRAIDRMPVPKDGERGHDGKDGFSLDDLQIEQPDERTVVLRFARGELVREHRIRLSHPLDQGVFREGETYQRGDGVTFGGSWWIAQKDAPIGKPGLSSEWRLAVKKGRDGKDWSKLP
jgi:hypothetical protein